MSRATFKRISADLCDEMRANGSTPTKAGFYPGYNQQSLRCRQCGKEIPKGAECLVFWYDPGGAMYWRYYALIHKTEAA